MFTEPTGELHLWVFISSTCLVRLNWMVCKIGESIIIFTQPLRSGRIWHKVFKWSLTGLNSEFTRAEELSLPYYLPIAGRRIIGFIPFPRVLVLCEMQSVSFRIWTRVAVSISYDDNHYTRGTSGRKYYTTAILWGAVVWTFSSHPVISKSSSPYINPSMTVPRAPIAIGIIVTFTFHSFSIL